MSEPSQIDQMEAYAKLLIQVHELQSQVDALTRKHKSKHDYEPAECELCHQVFRNKFTLKTHMHNKHNDNRERFTCPQCGKSLASKYYLATHIARMHNETPEVPNDKNTQ